MVRLSDAGWSVPTIARLLGQHEQTVRAWIKAFVAGGFDALPNKPRGGKQSALTPAMLEAVRAEVGAGTRTWTAAQLAEALRDEGIALSTRQTRKYLVAMGARWRRVQRTVRHKQDPAAVEHAERVLGSLKKRPPPAGSPSATSTSAGSARASR